MRTAPTDFRWTLGAGIAGLLFLATAVFVTGSSTPALIAIGLALIGLVAVISVRWPRAAIVGVVLGPILDRYIVAGLVPPELGQATHFVSEGLLLVVTLTLTVMAWRTGLLVAALRHPVTLALLAFAALAAISALINAVPIDVAIVGLVFTLDAATLFYLPRLVGFSLRQAELAVAAFLVLTIAAALVALAQALLSPDILGLAVVTGRFGEVYRLASFIGDPNVFGAFLAAAAPFALFASTALSGRARWLAIGIAFILLLALWLSFSRGSWLAMGLGATLVIAVLDRRTLLVTLAILAVAFGTAVVMPRDLLLGLDESRGRPDLVDSTVGRVDTIGDGRDLRTLFVVNALPIIGDHPVLGVGPGRYGGAAADLFGTPVYTEYGTDALLTDPQQRTVDNFWLHIVVETGVLGAAAFLAAAIMPGLRILAVARRATGRRRIILGGAAAAVAALAVSSLSTMLLEANSVGFLFWFLLGVGVLLCDAAFHADEELSPALG